MQEVTSSNLVFSTTHQDRLFRFGDSLFCIRRRGIPVRRADFPVPSRRIRTIAEAESPCGNERNAIRRAALPGYPPAGIRQRTTNGQKIDGKFRHTDRQAVAVRPHARRTGADRRRERDAPVRRAADRLVALPQGSRFDRRDDGPLAEKQGEARREIRTGHDSLRRRAAIGRRHEKIPFPDSAGPLHRVGLHPRRRRSASRRSRVAGWAAVSA